jgi:hypothetical protein
MTNFTPASEKKTHRPKRPRVVTGLSIGVFLISLYHLYKFSQVLINQRILKTLPLKVSPLYLAADGLVWGAFGVILSWGLWTGRPWARKACLVISICYACFFWIDLIWLSAPDQLQYRWIINLALTIIGLGMVFISITLPSSRAFFHGNPAKIN